MDITYIPSVRGFVCLAVVLDWAIGGFCRGGRRSRWKRHSAAIHWSMRWRVMASRRYSIPVGARISLARLHRCARQQRYRYQHRRQRSMERQRVGRAVVAQGQTRGGVSACLRQRRPSAQFDRPLSRFYNGRSPPSSLDGGARTKPTSTRCLTPARPPLIGAEIAVQTTGTSSDPRTAGDLSV